MQALKPPKLKKGDLIGLVSPASTPVPGEKVEKSVCYLERLGYRVLVGEHAMATHGYLAGRDEQRAADFNAMIHSEEVKAIFALRGGYGSPRILSMIDYKALRRTPKIISGFSDITALQLAIYKKCRLVTFSGPMPAVEFWQDPDPYTEGNFWRLITSPKKIGTLKNPADNPITILRPGKTAGVLLGGNLSLVVSTIGTPYLPSMREALLVLEEVDEYPYRVDRMLTQLRNSGIANSLRGVILGGFTRCEEKNPAKPHLTTEQVLNEFAAALSVPVLGNLQYAHVPLKLTIPFGLPARINSAKSTIEVLESAVV